jgi:hypothetical protein
MTLVISKGITLRKGYIGTDDPDAEAYIAAVEAADEAESPGVGALETSTKVAIHSFVKGCKNDGIWPAIKASCILAGARTLTGALVPLAGTAPTNVDGLFVSGDYNRKTGLVGDGSTKYLDSNRNSNADPQDSQHMSVYAASAGTFGRGYIGAGAASTGSTQFATSSIAPNNLVFRSRSSAQSGQLASAVNFIGCSRDNSTQAQLRAAGSTTTVSSTSETPFNGSIFVFARADGSNVAGSFADARLAFYSIGESLNLALLDARVTTLINAFGAAIP